MESFWYVFIHLFSINVLWFYSMYLKRKFLTGNILIAALTAMVPLLVGVFFYQTNKMQFAFAQPEDLHPFEHLENTQYFLIYIAAFLSIFAFLLNLAREIIKDMEDVEGDKKLNAKTVPIVLGLKSSKTMIVTFLLIAFAASVGIKYLIPEMSWMSYSPFIAVNLIILIIIALTFKSQSRKELRFINHLLKLSMSVGLLTPIFWKLLMEYGS